MGTFNRYKNELCLAGMMLFVWSCVHREAKEQKMVNEPAKVPPNEPAKVPEMGEVDLNAEQITLGNILADTIKNGMANDRMVFTGILNFNQEKLSSVNTRVDGRIERLYIKKTGDYVHKGDPLYELYSEPLNNAKQEYINALEQQRVIGNSLINYGAIVESAKGKLVLWGLTEGQIGRLGKAGGSGGTGGVAGAGGDNQVSTLTTFYSPEDGYVTAVDVQEGGYAMEGSPVIQLADLSSLWAEAQVFTTQLSALDKNSGVIVRIPDLDNLTIPGTIDFINPEINADTRINLVRVTIRNPGNRLHPGMPVYIEATNHQHHAIELPYVAVLTDSRGSVVWVEVKPGVYRVRMVQTGMSGENSVEITGGLREGDVVVTSGAYLINSEFIFQHGADPMAGMNMGK